MVKTDDNPDGLPMKIFDAYRDEMIKDRSQFFSEGEPGLDLELVAAGDGVRF